MTYNKKVLKCKYTDWEGMPVVELPLDIMFLPVPIGVVYAGKKPILNDVIISIQNEGMANPVQIVKTTAKDLRNQKAWYKHNMVDIPEALADTDIMYAVWGGCNRVEAGRRLGYTMIDCVVYDNDFTLARNNQAKMRVGFERFYQNRRA